MHNLTGDSNDAVYKEGGMKESKLILWEEVGPRGLRITYQSHRSCKFGNDEEYSWKFFIPGFKLYLSSDAHPDTYSKYNAIYVRGRDKQGDNNILEFSTTEARDECIQMFRAYNWYWNHERADGNDNRLYKLPDLGGGCIVYEIRAEDGCWWKGGKRPLPKKQEKFYHIGQRFTPCDSDDEYILTATMRDEVNLVCIATEGGGLLARSYGCTVDNIYKITEAEMKPFFDAGFRLKGKGEMTWALVIGHRSRRLRS
jgi:hypothetical protein